MGVLEDAREAQAVARAVGLVGGVVQLAQLLDTGVGEATISLRGSQPITLPAILPGLYVGYTTVWVLCEPGDGRAVLVLGPAGAQAAPPAPPAPPSGTVTAQATIAPQYTGTYRVDRGAWDRWNVDRYGGRSDVYQGSAYGSGQLLGLVCYGDQFANLGATAITAVILGVQRNGSGTPAAVTVQGAPHGTRPSGAPSSSGPTASSAVLTATGRGSIVLSADMREGLRTGAIKGLVLVGSTYAGVYGTSRADGFVARVTYTRPA